MIIMFREKMTVTILVKRCSTRRPLDCSNNIMLWLLHDDHKSFLLQTKSETHDVKEFLGSTDKGVNCWIKLNVDQAGFYRVKYDELLAARLRYAVEKQLLSASDRFGKLDIHLKIYFQWEEVDYTVLSNQMNVKRLGWETKPGESHLDAMSRGEILNALAVFGHDLTLDEASKRFQAFLKQKYTTSST
ncbi:Aminopeptidase M1 [Glycine soja]|uniref:Aminopeptidase M1 n=1 Tax=Glycine soja TaxID=3848 RepID=A0A445K548_GLYSO|nr:Aminopeptidase M1 [Glycine soja]